MAPRVTLPIEEKRRLVDECDVNITLNGQPALIGGWTRDFAMVAIKGTTLSAEFAWPTVKHIIDNKGGAFKA